MDREADGWLDRPKKWHIEVGAPPKSVNTVALAAETFMAEINPGRPTSIYSFSKSFQKQTKGSL